LEIFFKLIKNIISSLDFQTYIVSIVVPISAAFFGAWLGSRLSVRSQEKNNKLAECRRIYLAASLAASQCQRALSFKKQNSKPLLEQYNSGRKRTITTLGTPTFYKKIFIEYALLSLNFTGASVIRLEGEILNLTSGSTSEINQMSALSISVDNLTTTLDLRNKWIASFQENESRLTDNEKMNLYFGLPDRNGNINDEYKNYMENIESSVDDMIFHNYILYANLMKRLIKIRASSDEQEVRKLQIQLSNFQDSWEQGMFPKKINYNSWFVPMGKMNKKWYWSRKRYAEEQIKYLKLYD